ncbi:twin transmembrane helix small protein [Pseudogemmobacter bohemicus]|uniref:twin transmembrane helix small protein n=1 Tax=Pseudogemmobacter bohemicus TaxID=2250708 RepID=UPI000DD4DD77|nr:twin transmembrane helix small protein [Pseudogemmobacter bohemicus]
MLRDPLFLLAAFAALAVAAILIFGIGTFAKGGEFNRRNANKIMRWRLIAQFIAVIVLVAFAWFRRSGG